MTEPEQPTLAELPVAQVEDVDGSDPAELIGAEVDDDLDGEQ